MKKLLGIFILLLTSCGGEIPPSAEPGIWSLISVVEYNTCSSGQWISEAGKKSVTVWAGDRLVGPYYTEKTSKDATGRITVRQTWGYQSEKYVEENTHLDLYYRDVNFPDCQVVISTTGVKEFDL